MGRKQSQEHIRKRVEARRNNGTYIKFNLGHKPTNTKPNKGSFKKGCIPWNQGKRIKLNLEEIYHRRKNGESIRTIAKELGVSDRIIRIRLKENDYRTDILGLSKRTKQKISQTLKRKGIQPKERYSGPVWNKGKKLHYEVWNKGKNGIQTSTKKGKTFEEFYGEKKSKKIKSLIKQARAKQIFPVKDSSIEIKMQNFLKELGIEFYTHQYIKEIEHGYQCDIMIPVQKGIERKTIIECFGTYWHDYPIGREIDIKRCQELIGEGWKVLVLWENEINVMKLNDLKNELII